MDYSARRDMKGRKPNGGLIDITIQIGIPSESTDQKSWICPISVTGLHQNLGHIHGIDSWQSITLAQKTIKSLL